MRTSRSWSVKKRLRTQSESERANAMPRTTEPSSSTQASRAQSAGTTEADREAELVELGKAFRHVFRALRRLRGRDTHLLGSEVSHAQMELMIELSERGPLSAGELATAAQLTPGTVTQMLDHLAESGHVQRTRAEDDRRVVVTCLTPQGEGKVHNKRAAWQARWEQALADVDAEELGVATRVLERLRMVFEDTPAESECADSR
jgi:MarR family transcriptional regulator, organic hydroperoxide resistance regulator